MNGKTFLRSILFGVAMLVLASGMALAAAPSTPSASPVSPVSTIGPGPDPDSNPMLAEFMKAGAKVYYMGAQLGFQGWFIVKDNQVQIGYSLPDNKGLLVGVLFDAQGESVSSQQMRVLYDSNKEVNGLINAMNNQQQGQPIVPGQPQLPGQSYSPGMMAGNPARTPSPSSPGEQLMQALQNAAGVDVGAASAPKLFMVIDPNCPHCHEAWQTLRTAVFGGKLQIRLIPVGAFGPDSERASAQLLRSSDPLNAWDKYVAGDQSQLAGTPDASALAAVTNNHVLTDSWHINISPYIVYRAKNGQVKIVQGEPKEVATVLDDVGP